MPLPKHTTAGTIRARHRPATASGGGRQTSLNSGLNSKFIFAFVLLVSFVFTVFVPLLLFNHGEQQGSSTGGGANSYHGLDSHITKHRDNIKEYLASFVKDKAKENDETTATKGQSMSRPGALQSGNNVKRAPLANADPSKPFEIPSQLGRGKRILPTSQTPALIGARRGRISCDGADVNRLAYWNDPQGDWDRAFQSSFHVRREGGGDGGTKYLTFQPDSGGWNNIRISLENIIVLAAATGRTLVMPPDAPLYRLRADTKRKQRGFADFFPLEGSSEFRKRVEIISMEEFLRRTGTEGELQVEESARKKVFKAASACVNMKKMDNDCGHMWDHLKRVGYVPEIDADSHCIIFDEQVYQGRSFDKAVEKRIDQFCLKERKQVFYTPEYASHTLIHLSAGEKHHRLLVHFYSFILFTDPKIDNYYKRLVRDFLRYNDVIYCAAGKIVNAIQQEGLAKGFSLDEEGGGAYSSLHVRRGELQYKKVKISAEEWYDNTKEIWEPNEILYIATDERDKTFFDPLKQHHTLRFLDDYFDVANLTALDPNYFGMIDTIVAARGRAFAGTFRSTFTGYINRLRGYYGMDMTKSWYSFLPKKDVMQKWVYPERAYFAREFEIGWVGIDGDNIVTGRITEQGLMEDATSNSSITTS